jgi:amidohydrolase
MSKLLHKIRSISEEITGATVESRRHLHSNPELSFQEYNTAAYVAEKLESLGIYTEKGIAGTGVVGLIHGQNPQKKTIALRADMDALPIKEANDVPYKSRVPGVMHACGHDVHTSSLLGVATILSQLKHEFEGTVKLIFQPGEEKAPGGASLMIKDGVLTNPAPSSIIGQHVMPLLPVGTVGFRPGLYMASSDEIYLTVKGRGGHAAMPDYLIDPILISAHLIIALQQIVSRNANPKIPSVLSFGHVEAIGATNVIPHEVHIKGTFRTMNEKWRAEAKHKIRKLATQLAESMGGSCEVHILDGYPYLENNPELTLRMSEAAKDYLGEDKVVELDMWMASEDFAFYSHTTDACFYRLGTRNEQKGIVSGVHTPTFDIDEDALKIGPGLMAWLAVTELGT